MKTFGGGKASQRTTSINREKLKNYPLADPRQLFAEQHIDDPCAADTGFHQDHPGMITDDFSDNLSVAPEGMFTHFPEEFAAVRATMFTPTHGALHEARSGLFSVTLSDGNNVKYLIKLPPSRQIGSPPQIIHLCSNAAFSRAR